MNIWIPRDYPTHAPICLIAPTTSMGIRPGNYVDVNRRCYHPCLAYWNQDVRHSNLFDTIRNLQDVFSKQPPVHSVTNCLLSGYQHDPTPRPSASDAPSSAQIVDNQRELHLKAAPRSTIDIDADLTGHISQAGTIPVCQSTGNRSVSSYAPKVPAKVTDQNASSTSYSVKTESNLAGNAAKKAYAATRDRECQTDYHANNISESASRQLDLMNDDSESGTLRRSPKPERPMKPDISIALDAIVFQLRVRADQSYETFCQAMEYLRGKLYYLNTFLTSVERSAVQSNRIHELANKNATILRDRVKTASLVIAETRSTSFPDIDSCIVAQNLAYNQ